MPAGLTGTWRLVRLALRRDRIKLTVWVLALAVLVAANVPAVVSIYGKSAESQLEYFAVTAPSLASRIFGGPIGSPALGDIVINETFLFTGLAIAFMSTLAIVRHTRQNEETGRSELLASGIMGRYAPLTAALLVTVGANIVLAILLSLALIVNGLPISGSIGVAIAWGGIGIAFAGVAAITSQVSESARGANSMAAAAIGVAFLLRAVGDSIGELAPGTAGVASAWPSWLSPLGWAHQLYPYTEPQWWVLGLLGGLFVLCVASAFYLNGHRDMGMGLVATRKGPAHAPRSLRSAWGLARRLQRGVLRGWLISVAIMGVMLGLVSKEFADLFNENPDAKNFLEQIGGVGTLEDVFTAAMMAIMGICISGYAIQALLRMRSEESGGQLEGVLATAVSRPAWMLSHITYVVLGVAVLLGLLGVSFGAAYVYFAQASWSELPRIILAAMIQLPAVLALAGFAVLAFAALPRAAVAVSWAAFAGVLLIGQFGDLLKLPAAVQNISPFNHTPAYPVESIEWLPLAGIAFVAMVLGVMGLLIFRRRNLAAG